MKKIKYLIVVIVLSITAYFYFTPKQMDVVSVVKGPAVKAVYATGTVESVEMLPIAPRVSARISELLKKEGEKVEQGEVLARLESKESDAMKIQLESILDAARREFARQAELIKIRATSKELYDKAKSELEVAEAGLAGEVARKEYLEIRAPKDGLIIKRDGEIGQYVQSNQTIFWFTSSAPLRISAEVDEEDIPLVKIGQKVLIRSDAFKDKVFEGNVTGVTPKGDPIARSYRVRISFKEEVPLMIGMTAENNIIISEKLDALLIPSTAMFDNYVWLFKDGIIAKREVGLGVSGAEMIEIVKGLHESDIVLLNPTPELIEGQRIEAKKVAITTGK